MCTRHGIADPIDLENCILDVALTGRPEFATSARFFTPESTVNHNENADLGPTFVGEQWEVLLNQPDNPAVIQIEADAGEKLFVDVSTERFPDQCGNLRLVNESDSTVRSGCIINNRGIIDGTNITESGSYRIELSTSSSSELPASITLLRISDQKGTVTLDGDPVVAQIDKPGVISQTSFSAKAGTKVFVKVLDSTLPDQCNVIRILSGEGRSLGSGCIIGGRGHINTVEILEAGNYQVIVDPTGRNTGDATIVINTTADILKTISGDGAEERITLSKPGSIAEVQFPGNKGERVFLSFTNSTLPDQCGVTVLKDPSGSTIDSACIIGGDGTFDKAGSVLAETGLYTIRIDPSGDRTGTLDLFIER